MKQISAKETIDQLSTIFSRFGIPLSLRADNGPQINSSCEEFKAFCEELGRKLVNTIPYWAQQNGEVERQNRSILKRLRIAQELGHDWKKIVSQYILTYHATIHPTTGRSPSELMFGRRIRSKLPEIPRFDHTRSEVYDHDRLEKAKVKEYTDTKRKARYSEIVIGDHVIAKRMRKNKKLNTDYGDQSILDRPLCVYNLVIYGKIEWKWSNYIRVTHCPKYIKHPTRRRNSTQFWVVSTQFRS